MEVKMLNFNPKVKTDAAHSVCQRIDKIADARCQDPAYLKRHAIAVKNYNIILAQQTKIKKQ